MHARGFYGCNKDMEFHEYYGWGRASELWPHYTACNLHAECKILCIKAFCGVFANAAIVMRRSDEWSLEAEAVHKHYIVMRRSNEWSLGAGSCSQALYCDEAE